MIGKEIFEKAWTEDLSDKFSVKKNKYKRFETFLLGKIQVARNIQNKEFEILLEEILIAYKKLFKTKDIIIERIGFIRDGHSYDIYKGFDNDFRCWIYGDESPIIIDKEKINFILNIILNCDIGTHYSAKYFFNKIIEKYNLTINNDEFSGGKNRVLFYFPLYLVPMKIIEKEGLVKVTIGRGGGIFRIK